MDAREDGGRGKLPAVDGERQAQEIRIVLFDPIPVHGCNE
jgi:hypothetical protein